MLVGHVSTILPDPVPGTCAGAHYQSEVGIRLQLSFTARREFFFLAPRPGCKAKDGSINRELPRQFLHLEQNPKGKTLACTTLELNALNARLKDATMDCLQLTYQVSVAPVPCAL